MSTGILLVLSAPSGAGKTTLTQALCGRFPNLKKVVTHTTRLPRHNEKHERDYHFVTHQSFLELENAGFFIETTRLFGNCYGIAKSHIVENLANGQDLIALLDWQGFQNLKKFWPDLCSIFVLPPSKAALRHRLTTRKTDSELEMEHRLYGALEECQRCVDYQYLIINEQFDHAVEQLACIFQSQQFRAAQQLKQDWPILREISGPEVTSA